MPHSPHYPGMPGAFPGEGPGDANCPAPIWINYLLLAGFAFSTFLGWIGNVMGLAALVLGYLARSGARQRQQELAIAHASWQINTIWLALLLFVGGMAVSIGIAAWMGADPEASRELEAFRVSPTYKALEAIAAGEGDSVADPVAVVTDVFRRLWDIPGVKSLTLFLGIFALLYLLWPLKRVIQGFLALLGRTQPEGSAGRAFLSWVMAIVLNALLAAPFLL